MKKTSILAVIVAAALWGIDGVLLTPSLYSLKVPVVVFIECFIVSAILTPFYFFKLKSLKNLKKNDWLAIITVAFVGGVIGTMAITKALFYVNYVNLSIVILIQKLQPVFAIILAAIVLKEKLPGEFFLWASLAVIGTYLMTFGIAFPNLGTGDKTAIAAVFSLLAAISFASSTVFSKRALRNVGFELATYLRFTFSAIIMLFIILVTNSTANIFAISLHQLLVFLLIAFTTGGAAIFLYYFGLRNISASVATICELSFPLTAILLEYFLRGNILAPVQWLGVILLLFSIIKVSGFNR
ncbi:MAG: DMT family transporter [bacterium]